MTEKDLMLRGELYYFYDQELNQESRRCKNLIRKLNNTTENQVEDRVQIIKELFGNVGELCWIEPPFQCDYGSNIQVGNVVFFNYDCIVLDTCKVSIGNNVIIGPRVCIYTASHPICAEIRGEGFNIGKPITIGNDVWIGGNSVINPGVTIGSNVVIGAGSVVVKNIPENVIAVGNPCKVLRSITAEDNEYWNKMKEKYEMQMGSKEE